MGDLGSQLALNVYSRDQERIADRLAITALQGVYGHVGGATQLFEQVNAGQEMPEMLELLSTHPDMQDRIADLETMTSEQGWTRRAVEPYPDDIFELLKSIDV